MMMRQIFSPFMMVAFTTLLVLQSGPAHSQDAVEEELDAIEAASDQLDDETDVTLEPILEPTYQIPNDPSFDEQSVPAGRRAFVKPEGPPGGGVLKVEHPAAADGLLRIDKDGSYYYRTATPPKSQSASFRVVYQQSPVIVSKNGVRFEQVYGKSLVGLAGDYDWHAFSGKLGVIGLQLGGGLVLARGNGRFADGRLAEETYNFVVAPASVNLIYRFEYMERQWFVPFISGGITAYGLMEMRDDGKQPTYAWAPAANGGGGVHISISAWDRQSAFILAQEYGVADLWLTVEAKMVQGLDQNLDFTNQMISAGFTVDF